MNNFDEIFTQEINLTDEDKISSLKGWFLEAYDVKSVKDSKVLLTMLSLHEEDSEENKHFGHPEVTSAFGKAILQLVKFIDGWHIVYRSPNYAERVILHPKNEESYLHPMNRKVVNEMRSLLKNGSLAVPTPTISMPTSPTALVDGDKVQVLIPEEPLPDTLPDNISVTSLDPMSLINGSFGKSISVNIDDAGKS